MTESCGRYIHSYRNVKPKIYAYTTPEIKRHDGWIKIGYTEQDDVHDRIKQQTHTSDVIYKLEWTGNALFENTMLPFRDNDFRHYLVKLGYEKMPKNEWVNILPSDAKNKFYLYRESNGIISQDEDPVDYKLRPEQDNAISLTVDYFTNHDNSEFLWNAKPRFGKTLSVYDLCKRMGFKKVLIVTNRPAISTSWYDDFAKFLTEKSGYRFVSTDENLKNKKYVKTREWFDDYLINNPNSGIKLIEFLSLQDLKGSLYCGGDYDKLETEVKTKWDLLVIDEAHEGVDTYKTDRAFNNIKRNYTLHLSGTPFKAIAKGKFSDEAIFNWTYKDEQEAKANWHGEDDNPYFDLPKLNMFTYKMSDIVLDKISQGVDLSEGDSVDYAFDLMEFFRTNDAGTSFIHDEEIDKFLDALTTQEKFPFSTIELRNELKHTFWILNRVNSAKLLAKKLNNHPIFKEYKVVLAVGDGGNDEQDEAKSRKSYEAVKNAIKEFDRTITLSVGQLTTGVTIAEWTGVLMLCNAKSAAFYIQAAFRAQNPHLFYNDTNFFRKENAYVFDFDPARTLTIFEQFANDLSSKTTSGKGTEDDHKQNVKELLNYFPIYGEDNDGKMVELDAAKVLSIPRKIYSREVVRHGFMSNFLFQNISKVFAAPKEVLDILNKFEAVDEKTNGRKITQNPIDTTDIDLNGEGEIEIPKEKIIGTATEIFGKKVFDNTSVDKNVNEIFTTNDIDNKKDDIVASVADTLIKPIIQQAEIGLDSSLKKIEKNQLTNSLKQKAENIVKNTVDDYLDKKKILENQKDKSIQQCDSIEKQKDIFNEYQKQIDEAAKKMKEQLIGQIDSFTEQAKIEATEKVEVSIQETKRKANEIEIKDRLRGFSRTIPSFLMAYGDDTTRLSNFDEVIPNNVFEEVTGITLNQFRFLRDGGEYINDNGETVIFDGHIFNEVVFDDSITMFMKLRYDLKDYFDESKKEDIFDYIPAQKTNQIFTPKKVVKQMVDYLQQENPGCFDDPNKTFIDLYMKSGLYIAEIVKRLFNSSKLIELYPDKDERLKHIFEKQVYGLAPTEIIYNIACNFILGFDLDKHLIIKHNLRLYDALPVAKEGTLEKQLDKIYG